MRVDLLPTAGPAPAYAVPADNPFASATTTTGGNALPEIWAYGFRNPWKLAFDPASGEAIVVDESPAGEVLIVTIAGTVRRLVRDR